MNKRVHFHRVSTWTHPVGYSSLKWLDLNLVKIVLIATLYYSHPNRSLTQYKLSK